MTMATQLRNRAAIAAALTSAFALAGCASMGGGESATTLPVPDATGQLRDAQGADRGRVDVFKDGTGLKVEVVARGFAPGTYGMHIHTTGQCTPPDFASAGGHWNPTHAQHGRDNPMGAHHGDLPNLVVEEGAIGRASIQLVGTPLSGENGLLDADGAAFVIHAGPDDMRTDPSGNSGSRVACGVISVPAAG